MNRHQYVAELRNYLQQFMAPNDLEVVIRAYNKKFDMTEDVDELIASLESPMRTAVIMRKAYSPVRTGVGFGDKEADEPTPEEIAEKPEATEIVPETMKDAAQEAAAEVAEEVSEEAEAPAPAAESQPEPAAEPAPPQEEVPAEQEAPAAEAAPAPKAETTPEPEKARDDAAAAVQQQVGGFVAAFQAEMDRAMAQSAPKQTPAARAEPEKAEPEEEANPAEEAEAIESQTLESARAPQDTAPAAEISLEQQEESSEAETPAEAETEPEPEAAAEPETPEETPEEPEVEESAAPDMEVELYVESADGEETVGVVELAEVPAEEAAETLAQEAAAAEERVEELEKEAAPKRRGAFVGNTILAVIGGVLLAALGGIVLFLGLFLVDVGVRNQAAMLADSLLLYAGGGILFAVCLPILAGAVRLCVRRIIRVKKRYLDGLADDTPGKWGPYWKIILVLMLAFVLAAVVLVVVSKLTGGSFVRAIANVQHMLSIIDWEYYSQRFGIPALGSLFLFVR